MKKYNFVLQVLWGLIKSTVQMYWEEPGNTIFMLFSFSNCYLLEKEMEEV